MQELENHDSFHPQIKRGCGGEGEVDAAAAATAAADRRAPGRAA